MINGHFTFGLNVDALGLFREAIKEGVVRNSKGFVYVLNLCSGRLDFEFGRQVHARVVKGGESHAASKVSQQTPFRDAGSWTAIISCHARFTPNVDLYQRRVKFLTACWRGILAEPSKLMHRMQAEGIQVDDHVSATVDSHRQITSFKLFHC
ncbi:hypothetical protein SADUNF_Sadunf12G0104000 [Salix dunnii]|uniref:Uncharacterized protein n=1 Tax=Salix dunnii TaxID=1413687 RepID=A0A835JKJ3_9ROSI|nr:hypothetical protein SADUNF_Sadunf12G0104000 [Salix dunnii]